MVRRFLKRNWVVLLVISGPALLFFFPMLTGKVLYWGTPSLQFIPWQAYAWENLQEGVVPLWNPLNGMGSPLVANYQSGLFYPPNWLLFFFYAIGKVPWLAWGFALMTFLHLAWAGYGTVKFMRQLGVSELGQAVSGIAFTLCGFLIGRLGFSSMIWAAAWLPWIIFAAGRISMPVAGHKSGGEPPFLLVACLSMQLLAGHAQLTWYTGVLAALWVSAGGVMRGGLKQALKALLWFGGAVILSILISAVQLLPTAEYLSESQRAGAVNYETAMNFSFWPWRFLTIFMPDFFGNPGLGTYWGYASYWEDALYLGVIPIGLALSTLSLLNKRSQNSAPNKYRQIIVFAWIVMVISTIFAMGKFTPVYSFLYEYVPTFNMFNSPTRWMFLVQFLLVMLSGIGIDNWEAVKGKQKRLWHMVLGGIIALVISAMGAYFVLNSVNATFISSLLVLACFGVLGVLLVLNKPHRTDGRKWKIWTSILLTGIVVDLLAVSVLLVPLTDSAAYLKNKNNLAELIQPGTHQRIYVNKKDEHLIKFSRFFRFQDFRKIEADISLREVFLPNNNLLDELPSANNFDPVVPGRYALWMDYIATLPEDELINWLGLMNVGVWQVRDINSYQGIDYFLIKAWGRYQWYDDFLFAENGEYAWAYLTSTMNSLDLDDRLDSVILEYDPKSIRISDSSDQSGIPTNIREKISYPGYILLEIVADNNGVIVVADTWYPGWKVSIDDEDVELMRANYLFMGAYVEKGSHEVKFYYQPDIFLLGGFLSFLGCVIFISSFIIHRRKSHPGRN